MLLGNSGVQGGGARIVGASGGKRHVCLRHGGVSSSGNLLCDLGSDATTQACVFALLESWFGSCLVPDLSDSREGETTWARGI